jgi:molybdate transport system substrate-binding protein
MADEVRLFAAIAVRPAILPMLPGFEAASKLAVSATWELNPAVKSRIEAGAPFDVVVTNPDLVRDLVASGKVLEGSEVPFGRISMGVAARAGSSLPAIDTRDGFERLLTGARSVAYASEGTSGRHFSALLARLGIGDVVGPRLVPVPGGQTATSVVRGEAELAVVPVTSILAAGPEVMLVGAFPAELQSYIDFDVGIAAHAAGSRAARRMSEFLTSPEIDETLAAAGVERRPA